MELIKMETLLIKSKPSQHLVRNDLHHERVEQLDASNKFYSITTIQMAT
jgi:hypothetical protein